MLTIRNEFELKWPHRSRQRIGFVLQKLINAGPARTQLLENLYHGICQKSQEPFLGIDGHKIEINFSIKIPGNGPSQSLHVRESMHLHLGTVA